MDITCDKCQSKFKIPDEKIPAGKVASLRCPKCQNKISVGSGQDAEAGNAGNSLEDFSSDTYDAADKPFDFVEEEGKTALVCESDPALKKAITQTLSVMEYHITEAENARDALKKMRYHVYDLILVNEAFDTRNPDSNGVLIYLERLSMSIRRNIFVALISNRYRTFDNMMAFNKSVNLIINVKNVNDIGKILNRGMTDSDFFYRVYKGAVKAAGRT